VVHVCGGYIHLRWDDGNDDDGGRLFMGDDDAYCDSTGDGRILRERRNLRHDPAFHIFRRKNPSHPMSIRSGLLGNPKQNVVRRMGKS
jgi:hypothetical protein